MSRHLVMCKYMPHSDEIFSLRIALIQGTHTLYNFVYNSMPMKAKDISPSYDDNFFRHDADIPSSAVGAKVKKKNFKLNSLSLEMMSFLFLLDRLNGFSLVLLLSEGFISTLFWGFVCCLPDRLDSFVHPTHWRPQKYHCEVHKMPYLFSWPWHLQLSKAITNCHCASYQRNRTASDSSAIFDPISLNRSYMVVLAFS